MVLRNEFPVVVSFQLQLLRPDGRLSKTVPTVPNEDESSFRREPKPQFVRLSEDDSYKRKMDAYAKRGVEVSMEARELQGDNRVVVEGILSQEECDSLIEIASVRHFQFLVLVERFQFDQRFCLTNAEAFR